MKKMLTLALAVILYNPAEAQEIEILLEKAFKNSPVLKMQEYRESASREAFTKESILSKNPELSLSYSNVPLSEWPSLDKHPMSGVSIGISQYIAAPWEDTYRKRAVYQKYLSEKEALDEAVNLLAFQVQEKYHTILFLYLKRDILYKNSDTLANIQRIAGSLVSVNKMNSSHLLKLNADRLVILNNIIELDGMILNEQSNMDKLCGSAAEWNITAGAVDEWLKVESAAVTDEMFSVKEHPLYKKLLSLYEAQKALHNLEIARLSPGATLGLEYRLRQEIPGMDKGEDFISLRASMPVPLYYPFRERHGIREQEEMEKELEEALKSIEIDLNSKWKGTCENHKKLLIAFDGFEKEIVPGYRTAYQALIGALSSGTVSLIDVLDSYRMYLNASLERARLYRDILISRLRLDYLLFKYPGKEERKNGD